MIAERHLNDLVALVQEAYPGWDGFAHAPFVARETQPKRQAAQQAQAWLGASPLRALVEAAQYEEIVRRVERLGRAAHLLWLAQPRRSDLALLYQPGLPLAGWCAHMYELLHGADTLEQRLAAYYSFVSLHNLPDTWPLPTWLLFLLHPQQEILIRPRPWQWLLKFIGQGEQYQAHPSAPAYLALRAAAHALRDALAAYRPQDMIDVQSFIWTAYAAGRSRVASLDIRGQIELDQPASLSEEEGEEEEVAPAGPRLLREKAEGWSLTRPVTNVAEWEAETGRSAAELQQWTQALHRKGQIIFYGPPGTGKTFLAQRLAAYVVGRSDGFVELVQFHPAYAYEDFIQGLRPVARAGQLHYEMRPGLFLDFCRRAGMRQGPCVLIVDEINRANLAHVLGELMYLLEYRDQTASLAGGGVLHLPPNVRLIGAMNTADRSIALVDYALRRRFAFIRLQPHYALLRRQPGLDATLAERLISLLQRLNQHLEPAYQLGVSFFLTPTLAQDLPMIWQLEIEPYLEEYFFDQPGRLDPFRWEQVRPLLLPTR